LRARYPKLAHKMHTIENGIDGKLLALTRQRPDFSAARPMKLLTVGSLIPRKGINCIIEAIGRLADPQQVFLTVAGSGPERAGLEQMIKALGLSNNIEIIGAVEPQAVADLLARADVFVLASHSEGRPNVVLEAMAAALPVIATDIDGVRDVVEHGNTGLLYGVDDDSQLADNISRLRDDEDLRRQLGENARRWIIQRGLSWHNTSRQYASLYRGLAQKTAERKEA
jgi:glycosyltransferase involved in cell wall biosynthesis